MHSALVLQASPCQHIGLLRPRNSFSKIPGRNHSVLISIRRFGFEFVRSDWHTRNTMKDDPRVSREILIEDEDGLCSDGQLSGLPTSKDVLNGDTAPADLCRSSSSGTLTVKKRRTEQSINNKGRRSGLCKLASFASTVASF